MDKIYNHVCNYCWMGVYKSQEDEGYVDVVFPIRISLVIQAALART